jgi:hypothetical protein
MSAKIYNLAIERGADRDWLFYATDATGAAWPLATYTPIAQIKRSASATTALLTLATAKATVDGKEYIQVSITAEQTKSLLSGGVKFSPVFIGVWELDLIPESTAPKIRLFQGDVNVSPGGLT